MLLGLCSTRRKIFFFKVAQTGFREKSALSTCTFYLAATRSVVIIVMLLKLLQAEQIARNNQLPKGKAIALIGDSNQKEDPANDRKRILTPTCQLCTSLEIALSKKFKANILDPSGFAQRISLLAIDEIHLIEEWGKSFRPLYTEVEKIRTRIPPHVLLLGVSATLTKSNGETVSTLFD